MPGLSESESVFYCSIFGGWEADIYYYRQAQLRARAAAGNDHLFSSLRPLQSSKSSPSMASTSSQGYPSSSPSAIHQHTHKARDYPKSNNSDPDASSTALLGRHKVYTSNDSSYDAQGMTNHQLSTVGGANESSVSLGAPGWGFHTIDV